MQKAAALSGWILTCGRPAGSGRATAKHTRRSAQGSGLKDYEIARE